MRGAPLLHLSSRGKSDGAGPGGRRTVRGRGAEGAAFVVEARSGFLFLHNFRVTLGWYLRRHLIPDTGGMLRFQKTCPAGLIFSGARHVAGSPRALLLRGLPCLFRSFGAFFSVSRRHPP